VKPLGQWRVLIVGLGQIGGSLGLDLVERKLVARVIGYDINKDTTARAFQRGAVHEIAPSLEEGIGATDLVIIATPIRRVSEVINSIAPLLTIDQLVMDVAGTKTEILRTVTTFGVPVNYIGGHPIAGTEGIGIESAQTGLFENATFVLTRPAGQVWGQTCHPSNGSETRTNVRATQPEHWLEPIRELVTGLGARPIEMSAEEHDRLIALTSHLPHVLALALSSLAQKHHEHVPRTDDLLGGSFRSATRVASSSPELILDMLLTNRENVSAVTDEIIVELTALRTKLASGEESALRELIERVQSSRSGPLRS